jgi:hypothetical protein
VSYPCTACPSAAMIVRERERLRLLWLCSRELGSSCHVTYAHASWVARICAVAAAPIPLTRKHVGVTPALAGPVGFVAEHLAARATFEPIDGSINDADILSHTPYVPRAHKRTAIKLRARQVAAAEHGAVEHALQLQRQSWS